MNRSQAMAVVVSVLFLVLVSIIGVVIGKELSQRLSQRQLRNQAELVSVSQSLANLPDFASYQLQNTPFTASLPDTTISVAELSNIVHFERKDKVFSSFERSRLNTDAFVLRPNLDTFYNKDPDTATSRLDDWTDIYQTIGGGDITSRKPENSVFVSSDLLLHLYHRLLEKELEYIEQTVFLPKLTQLTDGLFFNAVDGYKSAISAEDKASYDRLTSYFAVPLVMLRTVSEDVKNEVVEDTGSDTLEAATQALNELKPQLSPAAYDRALAELTLIYSHDKTVAPPLFAEPNLAENLNITEDYTQYTPRSHYAKNAMLRSYFRSMMWFGRTNFLAKSNSLTRDALHITQLMNYADWQKLWADIYLPTAFLVGESDDLGITQYSQVLEQAKAETGDLTTQQIQVAQTAISNLPKPKIMSSIIVDETVPAMTKEELQNSTQGFRLFGQRFTPDAFVFTTLTQGQEKPDEKTGQSLPSSTTALFVMSAMGNVTADQFIPEWIQQNAPNSDKVLADRQSVLTKQFGELSEQDWTQNLYWSWLYTLKPLFTDYRGWTGYPTFMRSPNWNVKSLQTSLGSWTELKHDTLLYAKQSYAELGGGGGPEEIPPVPKGYVEPNIPFFDRLLSLSVFTRTGLQNSSALPQVFQARHETFEESLKFFRDIAVKQLANQKISDDDFERLRKEAGSLEMVLAPLPNEQSMEKDARSALIADVHTDAVKGEVLYEATAIPDYIYVAVKDVNGTRLTKGLVYAHYEFTGPLGSRETDQTWQAKNYQPNKSLLPPRPFWVRDLFSQ